ncbi:MAG TPA: hypothetical protein VKR38_00735 [Usitatibacter sp.]|nr:hypothetical protein [Usitatibacter sp.]
MSGGSEARARDKQELLAGSALCRMRLRRQAYGVRESLRWRPVAARALAAPLRYRVAFGLFVSWAGRPRAARMIHLAGRILSLTRLASAVIEGVRAG